jgi:hypothetical protein
VPVPQRTAVILNQPISERTRDISINDTIILNPSFFSSGPVADVKTTIVGYGKAFLREREELYEFFSADTGSFLTIFESRSGGTMQRETLFVNVSNKVPTIEWSERLTLAALKRPFLLNCKISDDGTLLKMAIDWNSTGKIDTVITLSKSKEPELAFSKPTLSGEKEKLLQCRFSITDEDRNVVWDTTEILLQYNPPTAIIGKNSIACAAVYVPISGATSNDAAGGRIEKYLWDFNGDGIIDTTLKHAQVEWVFFDAGDFPTILTVIDNDGNMSKPDTSFMTIIRDKPILSIAGTHTATAGQTVVFIGSAKSGCVPIEQFMWDFDGDGKWDYRSSTGGRASFIYKSLGGFNLRFSAIDQKGDSSCLIWPMNVR